MFLSFLEMVAGGVYGQSDIAQRRQGRKGATGAVRIPLDAFEWGGAVWLSASRSSRRSIHEFIHFSFVLVSSKCSFLTAAGFRGPRHVRSTAGGRSSEFCSYPYGVWEGKSQTSFRRNW